MPRVNIRGEVAYDHRGWALGARWLDDDRVIFQQPVEGAEDAWQMAVRRRGLIGRGDPLPHVFGGCNDLAAGGGLWMRRLDGHIPPLYGSHAWPMPNGRVGDIDRGGQWVCVSDDGLMLATSWGEVVRPAVQGGTRYMDGLLCWIDGGRVRVHDWMDGDVPVQQVGPGAAWALAFRGAGRVWVCYQTDAHGGACHPADDAALGYRYGDPQRIYDPDVLVTDGRCAIYWAEGEAQAESEIRRLDIPALGEGMEALTPIVQPPVVPPTVPPVIPPEVEPMKIPAAVIATIRDFASAYPVPHGDGSEEWIDSALRSIPDGWIHRLAQTVAARHGTQWGRKRASLDRPLSKESIALNDNGLHGWDLLAGAATGRPTLQTDSYHDLVAEGDQLFVPVEPFDHLSNVPVSPINRPALPFVVSASSFDWHLHRDLRWLDFLESVGIRTLRLVVASVFRRGASLAEGRTALREGLQMLRERGMSAIVTIHTDTRDRGLSRDEVRAHTKRVSDILVDFLDVVQGARLCNENSHSVEQSFMADPWFLLELDLLVDARIPLAWGANHGGEPVSAALAGGSWTAFHSDRDKMPDENAAIMRAAQDRFGKPVVDDEPIGFYVENQPGRRRNDPRFATLQALAARDAGLGGTTLHLDAGIDADVDKLDHVQREAARLFGEVFAGLEGPVTVDQIAKVFAGAFFEDVTKLLKLTGTVEERRIKVHDWARAKCRVINQAYIDIFKRPCDLEGYGSRLLLFVDHGWTDDQLRKALQDAYDRGDR